MTNEEIKKTWRRLAIPLIAGLIILIAGIAFHRLGSKRPGPQTLWLGVGFFGFFFTSVVVFKMYRFKSYLKNRKQQL